MKKINIHKYDDYREYLGALRDYEIQGQARRLRSVFDKAFPEYSSKEVMKLEKYIRGCFGVDFSNIETIMFGHPELAVMAEKARQYDLEEAEL